MIITLELESETPIYTQIRNQIVMGIASGQLKQGENLPSVRQLADELGINLHTVSKAYNLLKQEGFISILRNRGVKVSQGIKLHLEQEFKDIILKKLILLCGEARAGGIDKTEFIDMCSRSYDYYITGGAQHEHND